MDKGIIKQFKRSNILKELDANAIVNIANQVVCDIVDNFLKIDFNYIEMVKKIIDAKMYYVVVPKCMQDVNYIYEKNAIYFADKIELINNSENVYRECIHKLQEKRNKKNRVLKVGLCNFHDISAKGLAMNEAAVQYIISKVLNKKEEIVLVNKIKLPVKSFHYALITNLMNQISYLLGENVLVESTIKATDEFKYQCIDYFGEIGFSNIQSNFDKILKLRNSLGMYKKEEKVEEIKEEINLKYLETQKLIFNLYFEKIIKRLNNIEEIIECRRKMNQYENLIGYIDNKEEFEIYYNIQLNKLNEKEIEIKNKTALITVKGITKIIVKLRKLFGFNKQKESGIN